ncbi:terminase large subunit [Flavobacterium phage vB_FspS_morran9-1]|jgi:phage terminase large subunit|uniref:Terminase large subunit n=12 Tax=Lillamyvirus TaxID=2843418 RepID=A0A6B9LCM3_9CAUD|nr:terminase large subunit [Flavobacterium phage vB_FspS_lillamy9-1]YP_009854980.1 terminase large subunit [Flavobacterium phage vB_FspS_morran9-1]YP_009855189.1 terminase large subunit [Flavobacterium phage vB_FspS_sniff9-1]YP_009855401.1 terminase large subunit [Flavobacterium phage vB_FspS_stinky9-1]QHB39153.1 terminase large subunit [Flavobacterium phage vB_FspS_lillamy9-2]QHB39226.1 terminase large subunit [Flavobacterium phage vB_FspS_lillamy9-3]QHB39299.1 terminase large subunit [Flavo
MKIKATGVFEKNWEALQSGKYKYIINSGSSRSSKTFSILQIFWILAWSKERTKLSVFRNTKKDCKDTILQDMLKYYPTLDNYEFVKFNKTESIFTFPNGSTINIEGTDDELKVHGYHSDYLWFNEFYKMPKETFDQLDMRCSVAVFMDYNPVGRLWSDDLIKQDNAKLIHSTFKDNPFCPLEQKKKILSYEPTEYNLQQLTANAYMWQVYGLGLKAEKPNKIYHNWKVIPDDEFDMLPFSTYYGMDFGLSSPSAMVQMKFDGDKTFFFKEILYKPLNHIEGTLSTELDNLKIPKHIEIICDVGNELNKTEMQKLRNAGYNVLPAMKGAGSILSGIETIQKSTIYYTKSSKNIENEYDTYSWRIAQGVQLDEPEQTDDHLLDAMKYVISWYRRTRYLS